MASSLIDLHVHSSVSLDGEYAPEKLVRMAESVGVELLALADHNAVRGVVRAMAGAEGSCVRVVPAIEIDCIFQGIDLHLLGYGIDIDHPPLAALEAAVDAKVRAIFPETVEKLASVGIDVDPERVLEASGGKPPCGELIAEVLLAHEDTRHNPALAPYLPTGKRGDMPNINFYRDFCAQGKPAYVPIDFMSLSEAIQLVKQSGGIPLIAHPGANLHADLERIDAILDAGVEGIEVYSTYHDEALTAFFRQKATQHGVLMSCGSDFHGKNKPLIHIGDSYAGEDEAVIRAAMLPLAL